MKKVYFLILSAFLLVFPALADSYQEGRQAAIQGDFTKARFIWESLARKGNDDALVGLGKLYARGDGVALDYLKAHEYFLQAANRNNPDAEFSLGEMYRVGHGVQKDLNLAISWYRKAERHGSQKAKEVLRELKVASSSSIENRKKTMDNGQGVRTVSGFGKFKFGQTLSEVKTILRTRCGKPVYKDETVLVPRKNYLVMKCNKPIDIDGHGFEIVFYANPRDSTLYKLRKSEVLSEFMGAVEAQEPNLSRHRIQMIKVTSLCGFRCPVDEFKRVLEKKYGMPINVRNYLKYGKCFDYASYQIEFCDETATSYGFFITYRDIHQAEAVNNCYKRERMQRQQEEEDNKKSMSLDSL